MDDLVKVTVSEGKYTFGQRKDGSCYALRHGEPWREGIFDGMTLAMAYRIEELEAKLAKAVEALQWFIDNDDTNEGDEPMPHRGGMTWNEINAYWIDGLNNGRTTLAELKGQNDE